MKCLYLNAIVTIPNENGEEKIEKANNKESNGINYASLGISPPKGEVEYDEEGRVILDDEDVEEVTVPLIIVLDNLGSYVGNVDGGSTVYTKNNLMFSVIEEVFEIDTYLEIIEMSWFKKNWLFLKNFFRKICTRRNKDVSL